MSSGTTVPSPPRFFYHASGLALGGKLTGPVPGDIPGQAATSLPTIGGVATASTPGPFDHVGVVAIASGSSEVSGSDDGKVTPTFSTHARAEVTGLNILDLLTATAISAELFSTHQVGDLEITALPGGVMIPDADVGSSFIQNLRILNNPIIPVPDPLFFDNGTVTQLLAAQKASGAALNVKGASRSLTAYPAASEDLRHEDCPYVVSIFKNEFPIVIADFGKVYLGELLINRHSRQLTMLRIELDTPGPDGNGRVKAEIVVASVHGNGSDY
jgi:hypothetical protein